MASPLDYTLGYAGSPPAGLNWWQGNTFRMPALMATPPAGLLAPTATPQDQAAQQAVPQGAAQGGLLAPGGGNGGSATRDQQGPNAGSPFNGFSNPFSGTTGATPANFSSNYGTMGSNIGGAIGLGLGVPGIGMGLGALGEGIDTSRYGNVLGAAGIPFSPNYPSAVLAGLTSTPFGNLLGTSARQQSENARRDFMGQWGPTQGNVSSMPNASFDWVGSMIANNPAVFGIDMAPPDLAESAAPVSAYDTREQGGYDTQNNAQGWGLADRAAADMAAAGMGPGWGGGGGPAPGGDFGASPGPGPDAGGYGPGAGAGPDAGGAFGPGFAKGGMVRAPAMSMIDPPGPDDQMAGLETGEGVLTKDAMQHYPGLLAAANAKKIDRKKLRGLLS